MAKRGRIISDLTSSRVQECSYPVLFLSDKQNCQPSQTPARRQLSDITPSMHLNAIGAFLYGFCLVRTPE